MGVAVAVAFQVHMPRRLVVWPLGPNRVTAPLVDAGTGPERDDGAAPPVVRGGRQALVGVVAPAPAAWVVAG